MRTMLMQGRFEIPEKVLVNHGLIDYKELINKYTNQIFSDYLRNKNTCLITWLRKFNNLQLFNQVNSLLLDNNYVVIEITNKNTFATVAMNEAKVLSIITEQELKEIIFKYKFKKYRLNKNHNKTVNITKTVNGYKDTGLVRHGFMYASNTEFQYDTKAIKKYLPYIAKKLTKDLTLSTLEVSYQDMINELLVYMSNKNNTYTLGRNVSDSRGRSIFQCTKKIFNPISVKEARACVKYKPITLTEEGLNNIYAFIAELHGEKCLGGTFNDKINKGKELYDNNILPTINNNLSNLHEVIWLDRLYANLNSYNGYNWTVPIELDATASMLQIIGALTNNHEYLKGTNVIGNTYSDIWHVEGIARTQVKEAMIPLLYGSSASIIDLWENAKITYDREQYNNMYKALKEGKFKCANEFKDYIIGNVKTKPNMSIIINNELFDISCNKFTDVPTFKTVKIKAVKGTQGYKEYRYKKYITPDLESFKRYFMTLLIHNLDSQIANNVCELISILNEEIIPIHDAFIVNPNIGIYLKECYKNELYDIYINRHQILKEYFIMLGINIKNFDETKIEVSEFSTNCLK